jgi:hypothetical protein
MKKKNFSTILTTALAFCMMIAMMPGTALNVYAASDGGAVIGDATNLRFEISGSDIWCVWDAPSDWVAGTDSFKVSIYSMFRGPGHVQTTKGSSIPDMRITDTRMKLNLAQFDDTVGGQVEGSELGPYIFSVRSVSDDSPNEPYGSNSGPEVFSSTAYDRENGIISWSYPSLHPSEKVDSGASAQTTPPVTPAQPVTPVAPVQSTIPTAQTVKRSRTP